jgi:hypothetical protein
MEKRTVLSIRGAARQDKAPRPTAARWRPPVFEVSRDTYIRLQPAARNFLACTIRYFESEPGKDVVRK